MALNNEVRVAVESAPEGMSGRIVTPWSPDKVYGVAANWSQASAPVYAYHSSGWRPTGKQVADYCFDAGRALANEIKEALEAGGEQGDPVEILRRKDVSTFEYCDW